MVREVVWRGPGSRRIRIEGLVTLQALTNQNVEIQKILAFGGAFDSLLNIITAEGGVEGGVVVQDALQCLDMLLRLNVSNQVSFSFHITQ